MCIRDSFYTLAPALKKPRRRVPLKRKILVGFDEGLHALEQIFDQPRVGEWRWNSIRDDDVLVVGVRRENALKVVALQSHFLNELSCVAEGILAISPSGAKVSLFERRVDGFDSRGSLGVPRCVDWSIRRAFHQGFGQEANGADEVAGFGILACEDVKRYTRVRVLPEYRVHERKAVGDCVQRIQVSVSYTHLRAHETGRNLVCR